MSSSSLTTAQVLALPDTPQRRAMLAQLRRPAQVSQQRSPIGNASVLAWSCVLLLATRSEANGREHHMAKARRAKAQRTAVRDLLRQSALSLPPLPATVTLIRVGRRLLDTDNLGNALKAVQDGVADVYGVDDGRGERDGQYVWLRDQRTGTTPAVEVRVERLIDAAPPAARRATQCGSDGTRVVPAQPTQQTGSGGLW